MMGGDATELMMGRNTKALEKSRERVSLDTMKGSTTHGVPEDMKMVGIGSMPPPEAGYDLSDSLYMENMVKVERKKREEKRKEEELELLQYRMASSVAPTRPKVAHIAVSAIDIKVNALPDDIVKRVKVKKKRKHSIHDDEAKKQSKTRIIKTEKPKQEDTLGLVAYSSDES